MMQVIERKPSSLNKDYNVNSMSADSLATQGARAGICSNDLGWGLLNQYPLFRYFPNFSGV